MCSWCEEATQRDAEALSQRILRMRADNHQETLALEASRLGASWEFLKNNPVETIDVIRQGRFGRESIILREVSRYTQYFDSGPSMDTLVGGVLLDLQRRRAYDVSGVFRGDAIVTLDSARNLQVKPATALPAAIRHVMGLREQAVRLETHR